MSRKISILLLGGSGQVGSEFVKLSKNRYEIFAPTHQQLDVTNKPEVEAYIKHIKPDQIVYSIGFTSIDQAPTHVNEALDLNVFGISNVASIAATQKIPVHYLSTEVVFNGYKDGGPYNESDKPDPLSLNAKLKRLGELVTLDASLYNSVIRLIICYSCFYERKPDIARLAVRNLSEGKVFVSTSDQEINPIYVNHLIRAISLIIDNRASGIYHVGAKDYTTPAEFCKKIAKSLGLDPTLIKTTTFDQFSKTRPEPRPQHEWLDVSKFLNDFGQDALFTVDEGARAFAEDYQKLTLTSSSA